MDHRIAITVKLDPTIVEAIDREIADPPAKGWSGGRSKWLRMLIHEHLQIPWEDPHEHQRAVLKGAPNPHHPAYKKRPRTHEDRWAEARAAESRA